MWKSIDSAPIGMDMFVVKAFDVNDGHTGGQAYTSDPWCVWQEKEGEFSRWPHRFKPTHWIELPADVAMEEGQANEQDRRKYFDQFI